MYPIPAIQEALGETISGGFLFFCHNLVGTMRDNAMESSVPARQIRMISQEVSADVRLCLTVTCLYTMVGVGLVVAFM